MLGLLIGGFQSSLWTVRVLPGAAIVEVRAPITIVAVLHVVAIGLLGEGSHSPRRLEVVGRVHHLDIPEVAGLAEPFLREVAAAHLRGGVAAVGL